MKRGIRFIKPVLQKFHPILADTKISEVRPQCRNYLFPGTRPTERIFRRYERKERDWVMKILIYSPVLRAIND